DLGLDLGVEEILSGVALLVEEGDDGLGGGGAETVVGWGAAAYRGEELGDGLLQLGDVGEDGHQLNRLGRLSSGRIARSSVSKEWRHRLFWQRRMRRIQLTRLVVFTTSVWC